MVFETELRYFIANQDALVAKYAGKTLVIRGEDVTGVYDSPMEAYLDAEKRIGTGKYMIQPCESGPGAYTVTISPATTSPA